MDNATGTLLAILLVALWVGLSEWEQRRTHAAIVASLMAMRRAADEVKES